MFSKHKKSCLKRLVDNTRRDEHNLQKHIVKWTFNFANVIKSYPYVLFIHVFKTFEQHSHALACLAILSTLQYLVNMTPREMSIKLCKCRHVPYIIATCSCLFSKTFKSKHVLHYCLSFSSTLQYLVNMTFKSTHAKIVPGQSECRVDDGRASFIGQRKAELVAARSKEAGGLMPRLPCAMFSVTPQGTLVISVDAHGVHATRLIFIASFLLVLMVSLQQVVFCWRLKASILRHLIYSVGAVSVDAYCVLAVRFSLL